MFHDPVKMVFISGLSLIILTIFVLFYVFVFPKKKFNLLLLLVLISVLPTITIFRNGVYESGDFTLHIYRTISFYSNLVQGNLFPSWAGELNYTYGYPLFIFINPLPYILISLIHLLGVSYIYSMKIFLAGNFILSGITMYFLAKKITKNTLGAFAAGIFYLFFPYHLIDQNFRVDVGEILSFSILPLLLLSLAVSIEKKGMKYFITSGVLFALTILSHQATALFSLWIIVPYCLFLLVQEEKKVKTLLLLSVSAALGLLLSCYSWFSYFTQTKFTLLFLLPKMVSHVGLFGLLFSPFRFGFLFQGSEGELAYPIGYSQIFAIIIFFTLLIFGKVGKRFKSQGIFWLSLSILLIFMILPISQFLWNIIPGISVAAIASRFLLQLSICVSIVGGILISIFSTKKFIVFAFLWFTLGVTILNWGNRGMVNVSDSFLIKNLPQSTRVQEGLALLGDPKWINYKNNGIWEKTIPKNHLELVSGMANIKELARTNTEHIYKVNVQKQAKFEENTWFFPGWEIFVDNRKIAIDYKNKIHPGVMFFSASKGIHVIEVKFNDLPSRKLSELITVVSLILIGLFVCFKKYLNNFS